MNQKIIVSTTIGVALGIMIAELIDGGQMLKKLIG